MYYFDHMSARPPLSQVQEILTQTYARDWVNPSSTHSPGQKLLERLSASYHDLRSFLGACPQEALFFCSTPEEAIAQSIQGLYFEYARPTGKNHFLCTNLEEAPIMLNLEKISDWGASHDLIESNAQGEIDLENLQEQIQPRTQALCFSLANALTGVIQPIEEIAKICLEKGVKLLVDASSLAGLYPIDLKSLDLLTYSGGSLGSIGASGLLWTRKGLQLPSLIPCGQEGLHSNVAHPAGLLALATAAKITETNREASLWKLMALQECFEEKLKQEAWPVTVLFEKSLRLVHVSAIAFPGVHAELLAWHLNRQELYANFGGGMRQQLHYLLKACHIEEALSYASLSFSFTAQMEMETIEKAALLIAKTVRSLRTLHDF